MANEEIREQNIEKVLDAAVEVFTEYGVDGTTFGLIAGRAGVSMRSVQRYFGTKEKLAENIIGRVTGLMHAEIYNVLSSYEYKDLTGYEQVELIEKLRTQVAVNDWQQVMLVTELEVFFTRRSLGRETFEMNREIFDYMKDAIYKALKKGIADGSVRADTDIDVRTNVLSSGFKGLLQRAALYASNPEFSKISPPENLVNEFLSVALQTVKA